MVYFIKEILHFLQSPFSKEDNWFGLSRNFVTISVFMTLFLYIFQPSGISEVQSNKFWICLGFGISGSLGYFIYEFTFNQWLKLLNVSINWTYGRWLLYSLGVLFFISLANFLYARLLIFGYMDWQLFPYMIKGTLLFGIPMLTIIILFFWNEEKKHKEIAQGINQDQTNISTTVFSDDIVIFNIPVSQIKYIEALQNYVTIGFIDHQGQLKKQTERATLKSILATVKNQAIVRTHRSFLVNPKAITTADGNSQGLLLTLSNCNKKIPVSRSYVSVFRKN